MQTWSWVFVLVLLCVVSWVVQKLSRKGGSRGRRRGGRRATATGKVRATTHDGGEKGAGPDYSVRDVQGLSKSAKTVYLYLSAIADAQGRCYPFVKTIAESTRLSSSTVGKAIKELEGRGLMTHQQRVSRRGGSSNLYQIKRGGRHDG